LAAVSISGWVWRLRALPGSSQITSFFVRPLPPAQPRLAESREDLVTFPFVKPITALLQLRLSLFRSSTVDYSGLGGDYGRIGCPAREAVGWYHLPTYPNRQKTIASTEWKRCRSVAPNPRLRRLRKSQPSQRVVLDTTLPSMRLDIRHQSSHTAKPEWATAFSINRSSPRPKTHGLSKIMILDWDVHQSSSTAVGR